MEEKYSCLWARKHAIESDYHDTEWGVPISDDNKHFEMLTLESVQSGLSWYTVLIKRENYRESFFNFDTLNDSSESDCFVCCFFIIYLLVLSVCLITNKVNAQFYNGTHVGFGKNRVQYDYFEWKF